jgi:branched-subunit amino acid permease
MSNKLVLWVGGVLAALLIVVVVVVIVLINSITTEAENERYVECMAAQGYERGEQPQGVTDDNLDAYVEGMVEAAELCGK